VLKRRLAGRENGTQDIRVEEQSQIVSYLTVELNQSDMLCRYCGKTLQWPWGKDSFVYFWRDFVKL